MDSGLAWLPPLAANKNLAYVFLIAAILVATMTMLLRLYRYQRGEKRRRPASPIDRETRGLRAATPDSVVRWEVEMQELARDLKAEIDSKMIALGHLVRDADRAAGRLEKAMAAAAGVDEETRPSTARAPESEALCSQVYTLADYGFSVADIASRLATPSGQIELILRLREQKS